MATSSPGSISRTNLAPTMSSAAVSLATTQPVSRRPSTSGRKPCGSRAAYSVCSSMKTSEYAPLASGRTVAAAVSTVLARGDDPASPRGDSIPPDPPGRPPGEGMRRRWFTVAVVASSAFIAVYIPHVIRVGTKVVGFLPGYLQQENYTTGSRYGIIGLFIIGPLASVVAVLILAAIAIAVLQFADPDRPWRGAVVMTAGALAVTTPHYQWYSLLL